MNVKEKIGLRIKHERTTKGLTRKALAELTENLNISRINNYERGERTPGPDEITQLAKALEVSPAFLMGLSDDRDGEFSRNSGIGTLIPLLDYSQACEPNINIHKIKNELTHNKINFVPISTDIAKKISGDAFALEIKDNSMEPEFRINDILIFDPNAQLNPGDIVAVQIGNEMEVIIRKYKQLSTSTTQPKYELVTLNEDWANIHIDENSKGKIVACAIQLTRKIK
ncbi:LexA family transcriptional repressor [Legionella qingyii]|uniref:Helix-turn-helix domain-containing protein n=1 Tax=Legionella qingyii TaxID=2184757 RepID=A0A317TXZ4_9GAMM|nr:XRE family transcriptional regulator [Legionella qingyii]PWY54321.1 LexA family transcriptional repressor [Legionella qingyii]RUR24135.1 helix-turn-helix domain-containing protein [Legionella qingyii]